MGLAKYVEDNIRSHDERQIFMEDSFFYRDSLYSELNNMDIYTLVYETIRVQKIENEEEKHVVLWCLNCGNAFRFTKTRGGIIKKRDSTIQRDVRHAEINERR